MTSACCSAGSKLDKATSLGVKVVDEPRKGLTFARQAGFAASGDVAQTPEEFTDLVRKNSYDVILADYKLPNWNGLESVEILRRLRKQRQIFRRLTQEVNKSTIFINKGLWNGLSRF